LESNLIKSVLTNGKILLPDQIIEGDVLIENGIIKKIGHHVFVSDSGRLIDVEGKYVCPGFIDIHVNGGIGVDFSNANLNDFLKAVSFHNSHGTTAMLPTCVSSPIQKLRSFLGIVKEAGKRNPSVLGAHLNGPFVSTKRAGAMKSEYILKPSIDDLNMIIEGFENVLKIMTVAPEEINGIELIRSLLSRGIIPSLGHSDASFNDARKAYECGLRHFTHFYNAMRPLNHREPGAIGFGLINDDMTMELIVDKFHVHYAMIQLLLKLGGLSRLCLVTDATEAAGMPDGKYMLGGIEIIAKNGVVLTKEGVPGGSSLTMDRALANFIETSGVELLQAIKTVSENPARLLVIMDRKGTLEEGKDADLVVLDSSLHVCLSMVEGNMVFSNGLKVL
jgi:N-acetylglucosamine-6-phosphate deacetylase